LGICPLFFCTLFRDVIMPYVVDMTKGVRIRLSRTEADEAAYVGYDRFHTSAFRGDRNRMAKLNLTANVGASIVGAYGERAFFKFLGRPWEHLVDTFKAPDVPGTRYQVRTATKDTGDLVVRENDKDDEVFVLVVPNPSLPEFRIVGWMEGAEAKVPENWKQPNPSLPPAWFVPQAALHPIESLPHQLNLDDGWVV